MRVKSMIYTDAYHEDHTQALSCTILATYTRLYSLGALSGRAGAAASEARRSTALALAAADTDEPHTYVRISTRTCR